MARKIKPPTLTHCKVKLTANPRAPWRVWYPTESTDGEKPRRVFKSFAAEDAAWRWAEDRDRELGNHGVRFGSITPEARRAFDLYRDECGNSATIITKHYRKLVTAADAVRYFSIMPTTAENITSISEGRKAV